MAIMRVHKTANYTVMSNNHFKEKGMSLKAKGLLSLMLSLPEDWDYSINGLATLSKDGKHSVMEALKELERFGYLIRTRLTNEKGQFQGYDYDIFEEPQERHISEEPNTENPYSENPNTDNPPQLNTKASSTEEIKSVNNQDKIDKIDKREIGDFPIVEPNPFTKELIKSGYIEKDDLYIWDYNEEFAMLQAEFGYQIVRSCLWYFVKQNKFRNGIDERGEEVQNKLGYFRNAMRSNAEGLKARNNVADGTGWSWLAE